MDATVAIVTLEDPRIVECGRSVDGQETEFSFHVVDALNEDGPLEAVRSAFDDDRVRVVADVLLVPRGGPRVANDNLPFAVTDANVVIWATFLASSPVLGVWNAARSGYEADVERCQ